MKSAPDIAPEVVVTGTHIRGLKANASPSVELTREDLTQRGDATIADALQRLPQNFSGTANPVTVQVGSDRSGTNGMFSEGLNLRGLGANATLVLLNGRRVAGSGHAGNVADISAIPTAAVDHVEVLLDGASAIYGSDAVGGVVNIITRKAFNGAESLVRYGEADGGHAPMFQAAHTLGAAWADGHIMASIQFQRQGDLPASVRAYTANSDLTALGGSNYDTIYSSPGNILTLNAAKTAYVSAYALPAGSGLGLTPSSFIAGATNYQNSRLGSYVTPNQTSQGAYLSASQAMDAHTDLELEARFNQRTFKSLSGASQAILTVTNKNPFFVSPNGTTSELIGYSANDTVGPVQNAGRSTSYDAVVALHRTLPGSWRLSADVDTAGEHGKRLTTHQLNSTHLNEALGTSADDPNTPFSTKIDGYFNPFGTANAAGVIAFIGDGYSMEVDDDRVATVDLQADGDLFTLPGGAVKAAIGLQYRHERAEFATAAVTSSTPFLTGGTPYGRDDSAAYAELSVPLVRSANRLPGIERLTLSIAGRAERYSDVGSTANPKLGLIWVPAADLTLHASYSTAFRAPSLYEMHYNPVISVASLPDKVGSTLSLLQYGGNPGLKPETATSWTAGVQWLPHRLPGLRVSGNWFNVDYTNRIDNPGSTAATTVLINPAYASLVRRVNASNASDLAAVQALVAASTSSTVKLYPLAAYGAIVDARYLNVASLLVSGVDLNLRYGVSVGAERFTVSASATYLYNYRQKTTPDSSATQFVSTAGNPVDWRGRTTFDWTHGAFDAALTVNYVNHYSDPTNRRQIDSWSTADATLTWRAPTQNGPLRGVMLNAAVLNLFNADPPFYNNPFGIAFDAANASPFGRVVSVQISKRW